MASSAIWLLQNFSPTINLPTTITQKATNLPLETFKIYHWRNLPIAENYRLGLLFANIANLVCIKLNLKSIIEIDTE